MVKNKIKPPKKTASNSTVTKNKRSKKNSNITSTAENTHQSYRVVGGFQLLRSSVGLVLANFKIFGGVTVLYALLTLLLYQGSAVVGDFAAIKEELTSQYPGPVGQLSTGVALLGLLLYESNSNTASVSGAYQTFLTIVTSLAVIWLLRQVAAGESTVRIRDGFYKGMYPLVPSFLIVVLIVIQLLPLVLGASIFSNTVAKGITTNVIETVLWSLPLIGGFVYTMYLLTSSVIAAYIVTLPDMTPMKALRSAKQLVIGRRLMVTRKLLFLPLALFVLFGLAIVPLILVLPSTAPWVFLMLSLFAIVIIHSYLYSFYRELLK